MTEGQARELRERGERARHYLEDEIWQEAWGAYRERIMEEIDKASSDDTATVMHLKRLLAAAKAAKAHVEAIVTDGKVASKELELLEKLSLRQRIMRRIA